MTFACAPGLGLMKGFPNQVADLGKLATAMQCIVRLVDAGKQAKDDGVFGKELVRAGVAGAGHSPQPVEEIFAASFVKNRATRASGQRRGGCASSFDSRIH